MNINDLVSEVTVKDSATAVLDRVAAAMDRTADAEGRVQDGADQVTTKVTGSTRQIETYSRSFENLKRSVDPVYDAQTRLANTQATLTKYVSAGVVSQSEATATLDAYRARQALLGAETTKLTGTFGLNRVGLMELQAAGVNSFQALAAGMGPLRVASMEGAQVIGAFVQGGVSLGSVLSALSGPIGIVIGGIAALTVAYFSLRDSTKIATVSEEDYQSAIKAANELLDSAAEHRRRLTDAKVADTETTLNNSIAMERNNIALVNAALLAEKQLAEVDRAMGGFGGAKVSPDFVTGPMTALTKMLDAAQIRIDEAQKALNGLAHPSDDSALVQALTTKAVKEQTAALDEYIQHLRDDLTVTETDKASRDAQRAVIEAQSKAQQDFNNHLRDTPLLTDAEAAAVRNLAQAKTDEVAAQQKINDALKNQTQLREDTAKQQDQITLLQSETASMGLNSDRRATLIARLKAEADLRKLNIDTLTPEGQAYLANADKVAQLSDEYKRQQSTVQELQNFSSQSFDRIGADITQAFVEGSQSAVTFGSVVQGVLSEILQEFIKLAAVNPLKNALFGGNATTLSDVGGLFGSIFGGSSIASTAAADVASLPFFAGGGIMTARGPVPLNRYAGGGIADSPQLAVYGEGRTPEAYVPLPDGRRIPVAMHGMPANGNSVTVNVINNTSSAKATVTQGSDGRGGKRIDVTLDEMTASAIRLPGSKTGKALRETFGLTPGTIGR